MDPGPFVIRVSDDATQVRRDATRHPASRRDGAGRPDGAGLYGSVPGHRAVGGMIRGYDSTDVWIDVSDDVKHASYLKCLALHLWKQPYSDKAVKQTDFYTAMCLVDRLLHRTQPVSPKFILQVSMTFHPWSMYCVYGHSRNHSPKLGVVSRRVESTKNTLR